MTKNKSAAQRKSELEYRKRAVKSIKISFFPKDADIFAWLDSQDESKAQFIKNLIDAEIGKE